MYGLGVVVTYNSRSLVEVGLKQLSVVLREPVEASTDDAMTRLTRHAQDALTFTLTSVVVSTVFTERGPIRHTLVWDFSCAWA